MADHPCVDDPTSITGLARLVRERPRGWWLDLAAGLVPDPSVLRDATVGEVLRAGLLHELHPVGSQDLTRVRRARARAGRVDRAVGDVEMARIDDAFIDELRDRLTDAADPLLGKPLAASTTSKTLTTLRTLARRWARHCGEDSRVSFAPQGPTGRRGERKARAVVSVPEVGDLLHAAPTWLRAAIGLAVGAGMTHREIRLLTRGQIDLPTGRVVVFATIPGTEPHPQQVRLTWLPPWVRDLMDTACPFLARSDRHWPLFRSPRRPWGLRSSLTPALKAACVTAWGDGGPSYTFADLRRSWQSLCRAHRLPREVVRQSWGIWSDAHGRRLPAGAVRLSELLRSWDTLGGEVARPLWAPAPVPREAARRVKPWEPEPVPVEEPGLPTSCVLLDGWGDEAD
jgi:integrase